MIPYADPMSALCLTIAALSILNVLRLMVRAAVSQGTARGFKRVATAKVVRVQGKRIRGIIVP